MTDALSPGQRTRLLAAARAAREHAYAPYSRFAVGAAVLAGDAVYAGCNVENASYGLTVCAERVALFAAVAATGARPPGSGVPGAPRIRAVAVVTDTPTPTFPCGACRQVLHELGPSMTVLCATLEGAVAVRRLSDLLPDAFGPAQLPDQVQ